MKSLKKNYCLLLIALLFLFAFFAANLNRSASVRAEESVNVFDSSQAFSDYVNGNDNFYYMYGRENQGVSSFRLCVNKEFYGETYWQGSENSFNLIGKTKMYIGLANDEVSVRAFLVPMSGKVNVQIDYNLDAEDHASTENLQLFNGSVSVDDFTVSSTTAMTKQYDLTVSEGEYLYLMLHDNNGAPTGNTATHSKMIITYTQSSDEDVLSLNEKITLLPNAENVSASDFELFESAYIDYMELSILKKSFVSLNEKLIFGYNKSLALFVEQRINALPDSVTADNETEVYELSAILNGMNQEQLSYLTQGALTKLDNAVSICENLDLYDLYDLIDVIGDELTVSDKYYVTVVYNKYESLTQNAKDRMDSLKKQKLENAYKIISDYDLAAEIVAEIDLLPENPTLSDSTKIELLLQRYSVLVEEAKTLVTNYEKLVRAKQILDAMGTDSESYDSAFSGGSAQDSVGSVSDSGHGSDSNVDSQSSPEKARKRGGCSSSVSANGFLFMAFILFLPFAFKKIKK